MLLLLHLIKSHFFIVILREAAAKIETSDGQVGMVTRSLERINVSYAFNLMIRYIICMELLWRWNFSIYRMPDYAFNPG